MTEWIEWKWTEENPYPETLETEVFVRLSSGYEMNHSNSVELWEWDVVDNSTDITHYRLA
jgi:hypothetical protein